MTGIEDKNTKNSIQSKNYPKSKTLRELEKLDIDCLVYCYKAKCTMQWVEEDIRKDVRRLKIQHQLSQLTLRLSLVRLFEPTTCGLNLKRFSTAPQELSRPGRNANCRLSRKDEEKGKKMYNYLYFLRVTIEQYHNYQCYPIVRKHTSRDSLYIHKNLSQATIQE